MSRSLQTNYGVRFHNDPEGIVYPYMLVNSVLMKDRYPGLKEFCKKWFKGPEGKAHNKEADESASWILDMYDAYLEQMGDEAANLPYPIPGNKAGGGEADESVDQGEYNRGRQYRGTASAGPRYNRPTSLMAFD